MIATENCLDSLVVSKNKTTKAITRKKTWLYTASLFFVVTENLSMSGRGCPDCANWCGHTAHSRRHHFLGLSPGLCKNGEGVLSMYAFILSVPLTNEYD